MIKVILQRSKPYGPDHPTLGLMVVTVDGKAIGSVCTLELPWRNNRKGESCIPAGTYKLVWTRSPRFGRDMLLVAGVPGRSGIRIHAANYIRQLAGCIAPCTGHQDLDQDGRIDGRISAPALQRLEGWLPPGQEYTIHLFDPL